MLVIFDSIALTVTSNGSYLREFKRYIHEGVFSNLLLHSKLGMANLYPECPLVREIQLCDVGFFDRTGDFIVMFNPTDPTETADGLEPLEINDRWKNESILEPGVLACSEDSLKVSQIE